MADGKIEVGTGINLSGIKKDLKDLEKELARTEKEWEQLEEKKKSATKADEKIIDKDPELQTKEAQAAWERQCKAIQDIEREQEKVLKQQEKYRQNLDAMRQKYTDMQSLSNASNQVDQAVADDKFVSSIQTQERYNSLLSQTKAQMASMEAHAARISQETGKPASDILRANKAYQEASSTAKLLETRSKDINQNIKRTEKNLKKVNKETKKIGTSTKSGIAGFGKMGLAMMAVRFAMRAISAATQEYMAVNSKLEGQMNTLKALWGQVLGPAIEWVINLLFKAVSAVNAFVNALTGINLVARANEAALKKQAKAAGGAAQSAGFDEQTKLSDAGGDKSVTLLEDTVSNIPQKLKELLEGGDWYGSGKFVGESLMSGIEGVDWKSIGTKIGDIIGGAAAFAVGFILSIDPMTILTSAMELVTGFVDSITEVIQGMDWGDVGRQIMDLLMFSLVMSDPFRMIIGLMLTPEGTDLANSAAELVGSITGYATLDNPKGIF